MDPIHILGRVIYEPPLYSVLVAVQCCPSDSESGALSEVRGVMQGEVWNVQWQCHIQRSVCTQSAVRTHVKIMQSTCGLAAPAPAGPRPSTAAVSPDLRSPIVAWPWSADSYCQFTSLLWLRFTSAVTPSYEWARRRWEAQTSRFSFVLSMIQSGDWRKQWLWGVKH